MTLLAIDIGGSGTRAVLQGSQSIRIDGPPLRREDGRALIEQALESLQRALPAVPESVDTVVVGAAGLMSMADPAAVAASAHALWRPVRVVVGSDIVTNHLAVWRGEGGVVIAAGTGVTALGTDLDATWIRADGWGHLVGDLGGGAWIGSRGITAALRQRDGAPGGSAALLRAVVDRWGDATQVPAALSTGDSAPAILASFVPAVVAAAESGDALAGDILRHAGQQLADTADAVMQAGIPRRVALIGGLASTPGRITESFEASLRARHPDVTVRIGDATAVDGALWLAEAASRGTAPADHPPFFATYPSRGASPAPDIHNPSPEE